MKKILLISLLAFANCVFSQNREEVERKGKLLYRVEKSSWIATDLFLRDYPELKNSIGGYFSYCENYTSKCVFYNQEKMPKVIAEIIFKDNFSPDKIEISTKNREFTSLENDLYILRSVAVKEIQKNKMFKFYENTNLNIIPLIDGGEKFVYVLTGPVEPNVVIFGNDYLLKFNNKNKITFKKEFHNNLIPIEYENEQTDVTTMHTHSSHSSEIMTETDICTIMLYSEYAGWNQHIVFSDKKVSWWICNQQQLGVMTKEGWDKISK